jgi:glycosyltransferase involved in cell wall biosynthesis
MGDPMQISLFHSAFKGTGGAEVLAAMQAQALRSLGDQVDLVSFAFDSGTWDEPFHGINRHLVSKRHASDLLFFWDRVRQLSFRGRRAMRMLRELHPDLVFSHHHSCCAMLAAEDWDIPVAWYCHEPSRTLYPAVTNRNLVAAVQGGYPDASPSLRQVVSNWQKPSESSAKVAFDQVGVRKTRTIIANSQFCKGSIDKVYDRKDVEVVYPMVRFPDSTPHRQGMDRSGLQILVQTRLGLLKNIHIVLKGFALAQTRLGSGARVHVVGEGGERPHLEALCRELGIQSAVTFHGFLGWEKLREVKRACDVFALLPWDEFFGLVYPESAADGLLLLGPDHGGPMEILEGGAFGWTAPSHDANLVAEALESIWSLSDAEADQRRIEADKACRDRFSPHVIAPQLRKILANSLNR